MDLGQDNYTTAAQVQTYLDRDLDASETSALAIIIPAASRWIDRALGSCFDKLPTNIPFGQVGSGFTQRYVQGGWREINIPHVQQITLVEAINPYDHSVWYTYSAPLEYSAEPYNLPVKNSLRMRANEFTGNDLLWPGSGDPEAIRVTGLFTEYDYVNDRYPNDIVMLTNHIAAVFLQNRDNADPEQMEMIEGHRIQKRLDDLLGLDPMVTRIIESRLEVWLEDM